MSHVPVRSTGLFLGSNGSALPTKETNVSNGRTSMAGLGPEVSLEINTNRRVATQVGVIAFI